MGLDVIFQEEPRAYLVDGLPYGSVTGFLKAAGLQDDFRRVPPAVLEMARQRGDAVHMALMYLIQGRLNWATIDPRILGYVQAGEKFLLQSGVKVIAVEQKLGATWESVGKNGEDVMVGAGGRVDLVAWLHDHRGIFDWKTCSVMGKSIGPQTAGYDFLWNRCYPDEPVQERFGVRLGPDGNYKLVECKDPCDRAAFLASIVGTDQEKLHWREYYGYAKAA